MANNEQRVLNDFRKTNTRTFKKYQKIKKRNTKSRKRNRKTTKKRSINTRILIEGKKPSIFY